MMTTTDEKQLAGAFEWFHEATYRNIHTGELGRLIMPRDLHEQVMAECRLYGVPEPYKVHHTFYVGKN